MDPQDPGDTATVKQDPEVQPPSHASNTTTTTNGSAKSPDLTLLNPPSPLNSSLNNDGAVGSGSPIAEQRASKIAACLSCRRSKVRCEKGVDPSRCRRCAQTGGDCIRPTFNVGRRKGVKNKRKGLEKALFQVEEALKRAGPGVQSTDAGKAITELKAMLASGNEAQLNGAGDSHKRQRLMTTGSSEMQDSSSDDEDSPRSRKESSIGRRESIISQRPVKPEERLAVDDAENPLQLLARASNLHMSPVSSHDQSPGGVISQHAASVIDDDPEMRQVESFFGTTNFNLDTGEDYDPIDLGLVTEEESEMLFDFFHKNLAHTRWGLDPVIYTVPWTRSRSAFLFTSIMAASALFIETAGALSKRLSKHCKALAQKVVEKRHRSTEIVLAFMINVPWMGPGMHSTDDETCLYVSLATTIAIDLQLPKVNVSADAFRSGAMGGLARQDCLDPESALRSGGFTDVDPNSELGRRLLRRRERCWIALFVLERGMCLARGRAYTLPITPLIKRCDRWHISDIADGMDGALVSMAVLRRDLDGVFDTIRSMCDGSREGMTDGALIARSIQSTVDKFFEQWYLEWGQTIGLGPQNRLPPYVDILVTHTRLSIYSSVINHPTAPLEVRQFFRTAGLSAALNVMRAAVQGEKQLFSMPNNTAIMVSFAACFALRLTTQMSAVAAAQASSIGNSGGGSGGTGPVGGGSIGFGAGAGALAPSVRTLIEEMADVLAKIGNITRHRNGICSLYAKYLRILVKKAAVEAGVLSRHGLGTPSMASGQLYGGGGGGEGSRQSIPGGSGGSGGGGLSFTNTQIRKATPSTPSTNLGQGGGGGGFAIPPPPANTISPYDTGVPAWSTNPSDLFQFSSMSGDEIVEALNRAGGDFDPGHIGGFGGGLGGGGGGAGGGNGGGGVAGGFSWDDSGVFDWMPQWRNWPDFGF